MSQELKSVIKKACRNINSFSEITGGVRLRKYQRGAARAIVQSVLEKKGLSFVIMFPRQSGKNEIQAQIETYLLTLLSLSDAEIIKISPAWKPQGLNNMRRLERTLKKNLIARHMWKKESGYIYRIGNARIFFLSGDPDSNIVGATASTLLEIDEAQDIQVTKFDKDIAPMAASTNATKVFYGTAWTGNTLLAREMRAARQAEKKDHKKRVYWVTAENVMKEVPAYRDHVEEQVAKLGRNHPMIKTQYFSEEIDAEGGLFPAARIKRMKGTHKRSERAEEGKIYAMLIDVAGEEEQKNYEEESEIKRDSTVLTMVEVDLETQSDELIRKPSYRTVERWVWAGTKQTNLYGEIKKIFEDWRCKKLVIDATGIGTGLSSFLSQAIPGKVIPFIFTSASKSKLGWDFLSVIDTGRYKEFMPFDEMLEMQLRNCNYEIQAGPEKKMKWGVSDGTRDPESGELIHDDLITSAALVAVLDDVEWKITKPTVIIQRKDVLKELDKGY